MCDLNRITVFSASSEAVICEEFHTNEVGKPNEKMRSNLMISFEIMLKPRDEKMQG